jgi:alpha-1,2-mannosyltransferase
MNLQVLPVTGRATEIGLGATLLAEAGLLGAAVHSGANRQLRVLAWEGAAFAAFVVALALLRRTPRPAWFILGGGALLQLVALTAAPATSDDDHRYIWDAKVQLAGIDPYRYSPIASELAPLRDGFLFPTARPCPNLLVVGTCININHPSAHTIYPPVAQAIFVLVRLGSFGGRGNSLPLQVAAAAGALACAALLARRGAQDGRPLWPVALWAWCPVTAIELGNNGHIDWAAVLLSLLAIDAARRGATGRAGALIGAGIATKLYPGLLLAPLARRRPVATIGAAVAVVAASYVPHLFTVGAGVLGYLPSYLRADGYDNGGRYRLIGALLPAPVATPAAVLALLSVLAWAWLRSVDHDPTTACLIVVGTAMLVTTPSYPWYALLLLALAAMAGRPEWLGVVVAPTVIYLAVAAGAPAGPTSTAGYAAGAAVLVAAPMLRRATEWAR